MSKKIEKQIIGRYEHIDFPDFNFFKIKAKIDSGAYHGAIHTSDRREETINGHNVLSFALFDPGCEGYTGERIFVDKFRKIKVTSSNNISEVRYLIHVKFSLGSGTFVSEFSLTSRGERKIPVLIGRSNIKNHFIIDVSKTFVLSKI